MPIAPSLEQIDAAIDFQLGWCRWRARTPKHGSWLDMAESELGVLAAQCLADKQILSREVGQLAIQTARQDPQFG
jgi:hypothetical protein